MTENDPKIAQDSDTFAAGADDATVTDSGTESSQGIPHATAGDNPTKTDDDGREVEQHEVVDSHPGTKDYTDDTVSFLKGRKRRKQAEVVEILLGAGWPPERIRDLLTTDG